MTQVSNNVNFTSNYPVVNNSARPQAAQAQPVQIENGSEKSINALAWMGKIAVASLAVAGIGAAAIKGKGIDPKYVDMDKLAREGIAVLNDDGVANIGKISKFVNQIGPDGKTINSARIIQDIGGKKVKILVRNGHRISQETLAPVAGRKAEKIREIFDENNNVIRTIKNGEDVVSLTNPEGAQTFVSASKKVGTYGNARQYKILDESGAEKFAASYVKTQDGRIEANLKRVDSSEVIEYKKLPYRGNKKVKAGIQETVVITRGDGAPTKLHIEQNSPRSPYKVSLGESKAIKFKNHSQFREYFKTQTGIEYDELISMLNKVVIE
ncbi:hypothetical protein IJ425_05865 [bacterium]|nr:hypothetical protein [bacterium]